MNDANIEDARLKEEYLKTYEARAKRKESIRTNTHKFIAKAKANIEAVEKGMFGVEH